MAISRDDLQFCISKFLKFLLFSAWDFSKRHPFFSWTLLLFSFLYVFFPWVFWSLIYLSASSILVYSVTRVYFSSQSNNSTTGHANRNANSLRSLVHSSKDIGLNVRNGRPIVRARSVRQRKSRGTSSNSSVQGSEDEKSTVLSSTFNNDMVDKGPLIEENTKDIQEVKVDAKVIIHGECSTSNVSGGLKQELNGKSQPESKKFVKRIDSESESSQEDEQDREDNNKAVQWTEDDQKNLMDLGLSEIERNKRLESLMARRRAKKLLSLQIRRTLNKGIGLMAPIVIPEHKNYSQGHTTTQLSPMPGSAPSILLPVHDPFDLPYDPLEEKPILTGGSFHQEFIAPEPKDSVFCRHESLCLGDPSPKEFKEDQQETQPRDSTDNRSSEGPEDSNAGNQLEVKDTDKIIEMESCQSPKSNLKKIIVDQCNDEEIQRSENGIVLANIDQENPSANVETNATMVDNPISKSGSTSSEEDVPLSKVDKEAILKSLASPYPKNVSLDKDITNQVGYDLRSYDTSMMDKVRTYCVASDLQVEVSEVSSPPKVGSISSFDIRSPIEEDDLPKDFPYGNEVMWEISSQPSRNDEDDSRLSEICKLHEENTTKFGFSRLEEPKESVVSNELVKVLKEKEVVGSLVSGPNGELLNVSHEYLPGFHMEFKDSIQTSNSETSQASTSGTSTCVTETSNSISAGLIGRQQEKKENHYNIDDQKDDQIDKNDASRTPNGTQRELEKQIKVDESASNEDINIVEPTATNEDGEHISEAGSSTNGSFIHQAPTLERRPVLEDVPITSGMPSPKSVLQPKFSMDQLYSLDSSEDVHVDIHQVYTHTVENNTWDEARGATSTSATLPGGTAPSEDSTSQSWLSQEESHPSASAMKAQSHPLKTSSSVTKDERKLDETTTTPESSAARMSSPTTTTASGNSTEEMNPSTLDKINDDKSEDPQKALPLPAFRNPSGQVNKSTSSLVNTKESFHPSTSSMEINSCPSSTEARYAEQEGKQSDVMRILESDSTRTNTPDTTAALQKPVGEINASILVKVNDKLGEPHEDTAQIALANLGEEVNKSSRPVFNTTESSHPSTSSVEANSFPSRTETGVVEHERTLNDATKIPESTSTRTSRPDLILARKPMEEASPSTLDMINNKPADPHKHAAPSALANSNEQVSQLNRLLVSKKDSSSPSVSSTESNSFPSTTQTKVVEHEKRQNETSKISESTSTWISGPNTLAMLQKPMEETNPSTLGRINNQLEDPDKHAAPPTLANSNEQPEHLNRLLLHTEEFSHHSASPMEVNSFPSSTESNVAEHERRQNENIENHEKTSTRTGHVDTVVAVQKPIKETNPSTLNKIRDKSDGPHEHVAPPAKVYLDNQVDQINTLLVNTKESHLLQNLP